MTDPIETQALAGFRRWVQDEKPDLTDHDKELWAAYAGHVK